MDQSKSDPRDIALQSVTPTVMVPRYTALEELTTPGHRLLMAGNGVWLETCRAWMYSRIPVGQQPCVAVPYGMVTEDLRFKFGDLPRALVAQFIGHARTRCPNECAAWIVWNERTGTCRLEMLDDEISVGHGHVNVNLPVLEEDEHLVIDLHSHGTTSAFFSRTDNKDDKGEVKISGVIGNLDQEQVTIALRLCVSGMFVKIPF